MGYLSNTGLARVWSVIKAKLATKLDITGGTLTGDLAIVPPGTDSRNRNGRLLVSRHVANPEEIGPTAEITVNRTPLNELSAIISAYPGDGKSGAPFNFLRMTDTKTSFDKPLDQLSLPYRIATGRVSITPTAANVMTEMSVLFPSGLFTATPRVFVSALTAVTAVQSARASQVSQTGMTIYVLRTNTTSTNVDWFAVQEL